ncbi:HNH endonuclease signature motif containing protein [Paraburkholderia acidisoli]|uniref:HNH nuclease domain-containing protein n=1 Tax=Paraburkholderia acidisoli TaxID=2571748 RepID=A0A7Z2GR79_9BURK|nr:HNH endonuclease signature motif containing protein [Paraburkholderia acidisoli]QGZ66317.1 hypothetical protein FAZ98_31480 [Paraburkholderia acidisoli]QGZ66402.1 hypothetical protein FAZ98_31965 [Paraburkholderia acidisoli]
MATIESLMSRTRKVGDCLEFTGYICKAGYGLVWHNGKNRLAHRVSFDLHHGTITDGRDVMHSCDNRKCLNPKHLNLGTRLENMQDMIAKRRDKHPCGLHSGMSKITPEIAIEIRRRYTPYSRTDSSCALGREFGISQAAVWAIITGKTWADCS